jgi:hypothetical protein
MIAIDLYIVDPYIVYDLTLFNGIAFISHRSILELITGKKQLESLIIHFTGIDLSQHYIGIY